MKSNVKLMNRNLEKVLNLARTSQVSSVLLTGKGEPFLNLDEVVFFVRTFREFPLEIQTNGIWLSQNLAKVETLVDLGLNVVAVSVDNCDFSPIGTMPFENMVRVLHDNGMLCRVCFNVTNKFAIVPRLNFGDLLCLMSYVRADQFTLRNIVVPNFTKETPQSKWIKENVDPDLYPRLASELKEMCQAKGQLLRNLPYGAKVYQLDDIAVSYSDYCIQDSNNMDDIRSLIFQEDGHVYSSWNSRASAIF
jgi:molybdenum cofactor biosynthesis enzyme MoaA